VRGPLGLAAFAAGLLALIGLLGTALASEPRLSVSDLGPWIVVWAIGLFALLGVAPFAIHSRVTTRTTDPDRRWELAIVVWGGVATAGLLAFGAIALLASFDTGSALGALAVVGLLECALVAGSVLLVMLTGG
jgi:hypothetical protein